MSIIAMSLCTAIAQADVIDYDNPGKVVNNEYWDIDDQLIVGDSSAGSLTVKNHGAVSNTAGVIGYQKDSMGTVEVSGEKSTWTNSGQLIVGSAGQGRLTITDGGVVSNRYSFIGSGKDSIGTVEVKDSGSTWSNSGYLYVGLSGQGNLTITDAGAVSSAAGFIGYQKDSMSTVEVSGKKSTWTNSGQLIVGYSGQGRLTITDGGAVSNTVGVIGYQKDSLGTVEVKGSGSTWSNSDRLYVGYSGEGKLTITDGGAVCTEGTVYIGRNDTGSGTLNIGAAEGDAARTAGTLQATGLVFGAGKDNGTVVFNHTHTDYVFAIPMSSSSNSNSRVKLLSGTTILTGANTYYGDTLIVGGTLQAGGEQTLSANSTHTVQRNASLNPDGYAQIMRDLNNAGHVQIGSATSANGLGTTLTVTGNYVGDGGRLSLRTALGDDSSASDKLVIDGGSATGRTKLDIINVGGTGAETTRDGILLIEAVSNGTTAEDAFSLNDRVAAGAYEYHLFRGGEAGADNWYLRSAGHRAEIGSYLANLQAAHSLFNLRLKDRAVHAEHARVWVRMVNGVNRTEAGGGQFKTTGLRSVLQVGGDVWAHQLNNASWISTGLMGAYGHTRHKSRTASATHHATGKMDGHSVGLYGTWYQNGQTEDGAYVDSWLQYSAFTARVIDDKSTEKYRIQGVSASIEGGVRIPLQRHAQGGYTLTPQLQVIWNHAKADDHHEQNGARVRGHNAGAIQTRLGTQFAHEHLLDGRRLLTAYVEANWLYNSQLHRVAFDDVQIKQDGSRHMLEFKLGLEGEISKQMRIWANAVHQSGAGGYRDLSATVGWKYCF